MITDLLRKQIDQCLETGLKGSWLLRFPAELEERFERDQWDQRASEQRKVGILATILLNLFVFSDFLISPASLGRSIFYRLGVFTPWAILVLILVPRRGVMMRELLMLSTIALGSFVVLMASPGGGPAEIAAAEFGMLLVLFFGALTIALRFPYAVAAAAIVIVQGSIYAAREPWLTLPEIFNIDMLTTTSAILALVSNYKAERGVRMAYLFYMREEHRRRSLAVQNRDLAELSNADGLTGLANRRHFDAGLRDLWETERRDCFPVSLIMLDIDHFKRLNDTFGHPFGDHVLMVLAGILRAHVRTEGDIAARYGGEEFSIILPGQNQEQALKIAERLCREVRATPIVTINSEQTVSITISCGVSTAGMRAGPSPESLIAAADGALYQAKRGGRDRVCVSA
jgi:diguanylate cyclase (GGDEF)-like protein